MSRGFRRIASPRAFKGGARGIGLAAACLSICGMYGAPRAALAGPPRAIGARTSGKATASGVRVDADVDRTTVGLGDVVRYSLTATTTTAAPVTAADPGRIDGFDFLGSGTSTQQSISMSGGRVQRVSSVTVTFTLRAKALGKHTIGPGRIVAGGESVTGPPAIVTVVPAGRAAPPPPQPQPFDPFDDFFRDRPEPRQPEPETPTDPLAVVEHLPSDVADRDVFVRVAPDEKNPVVGAQLTATLFVYVRRRTPLKMTRPPPFPDFASIDLAHHDREMHPIVIEGERWSYAVVSKYALFPLHTGKSTIGAAEIESSANDRFGMPTGAAVAHVSAPVEIEAVEPPAKDRPSGYVVGDVAAGLELSAEVSPRTNVRDGHALVTLRMRGLGRLDALRLDLPSRRGVTWTLTGDEAKTDVEGLHVRGTRKVSYDLAFDRPGDTDIGDALVHVWDPAKKAYASATASLGRVRVEKPFASAATGASEGAPLVVPLPDARTTIGALGQGETIADQAWTWSVILGAPILVVLAQGGAALARRTKRRAGERGASPAARAAEALDEARRAEQAGDTGAACAAMARALDRAVEGSTGIRARGLTAGELSRALEETPLSKTGELGNGVAARVVATFGAIDDARFAGGISPTVAAVEALVAQVQQAGTRPAGSTDAKGA